MDQLELSQYITASELVEHTEKYGIKDRQVLLRWVKMGILIPNIARKDTNLFKVEDALPQIERIVELMKDYKLPAIAALLKNERIMKQERKKTRRT
jgi:hypothetical protein